MQIALKKGAVDNVDVLKRNLAAQHQISLVVGDTQEIEELSLSSLALHGEPGHRTPSSFGKISRRGSAAPAVQLFQATQHLMDVFHRAQRVFPKGPGQVLRLSKGVLQFSAPVLPELIPEPSPGEEHHAATKNRHQKHCSRKGFSFSHGPPSPPGSFFRRVVVVQISDMPPV